MYLRELIINKIILETDGGLAPDYKAVLEEKYKLFTDQQLVDLLYSQGWQQGYDKGYDDAAEYQ